MATNTTKLGLIKPDFVDVVDITDLNTNADDIDAAVGFTICTNATRPSTPWTGQSIFETDTASSFIWDGTAWQPGGGGGSIEISATAPSSPAQGDLWWDSDNGNLYIYYDDGNSQQWVAANGPQVFVGTTAPPGYQGQLWFDSTEGKTYIYYDDGTSAQWISAIGGETKIDISTPAINQKLVYNGTAFVNEYEGMTHLVTQAFSGVATVNVSNVFTDNYSTYAVFLDATASASANIMLRYRQNVTDVTGSVYSGAGFFVSVAGATSAYDSGSSRTAILFLGGNTNKNNASIIFQRPNSGVDMYTLANGQDGSSSLIIRSDRVLGQTNMNGFSIYVGSGTITGNVRVYGIANS